MKTDSQSITTTITAARIVMLPTDKTPTAHPFRVITTPFGGTADPPKPRKSAPVPHPSAMQAI